MKQTAVEWLVEQLTAIGQLEIPKGSNVITLIIEKAKEMEKQQMRDASCPFIGGWEDDEFEYWYNETFKK